MIVEIITTGTELLLGQIVNSNAAILSQFANKLGFNVFYQTSVGDNRIRMKEVFKTALSRADIIITSGGLGPTLGDITKEVSAELLGLKLELHQESKERIESFFQKRNAEITPNNLRQAMIHHGAIAVTNNFGTAPGVIIELENNKVMIHLPGPPGEIKPMLEESIEPYLKKKFNPQGIIFSKTLLVCGIGESLLEEKIKTYILNQENPTIALLVKNGIIHIRITAKASNEAEANKLISNVELSIRKTLGKFVFGENGDTLEEIVGNLLRKSNLKIALAESCTSGLISSKITDIPGASDYFTGSIVCYDNKIKENFVKVPPETLAEHGAVSKETAIKMAEGIKNQFSADIGLSVTGILGPGGATELKPVGLVYIAIATKDTTVYFKHRLTGSRIDNKHRTYLAALNHLKDILLGF
ncbi:competence/damage-inducible protein A [Selenomonadales bacterium OttesenSCG-928-I06]|nr:competence/damage-inducible protein A [Selenomonadales bacterium OttesenSCG-928-I06]